MFSLGPPATRPVGHAQLSPPVAWPRDDLVRRLCLAFDIAKRALAVLAQDGYRDEQEPDGSFGPDKPFAETAMLLHVAAAARDEPAVDAGVAELGALLARLARSHRTACAIALHPTICFQLAMPHLLLRRLGLRDERFDRLLALSAASRAAEGREVVPHRALERLWLRSMWHDDDALDAAFDVAASLSVLNHPLDLMWGARDDAYAHTHALMYATDFGYASRTLPRPRPQVLAESSALLARSLLLEDYDLTAEVLMAWPLTGASWTPAAAFGFRTLAELEDTVGFLPAKHGTPEKFLALTGHERTKYALAAAYHTAFVMGMLCALGLRPEHAPPATIDGPSASDVLIDALSDSIEEVETPWRQTFRRLAREERCALAPFLLDLALLDRGRRHDYAAVARLLGLAVQHDLADTPLCAQSAELLGRVAACAEAR